MHPNTKLLRHFLARCPPLDIRRYPKLQKFNAGARVLPYDKYVYFLSTDYHVCRMPMHYARWFNWCYPIEADLSGIADDLDVPLCDYIYYKPVDLLKEDFNNVP